MVTTYTEKMDWQLDAAELRVLGALMEKEKTTPEYYPMSLNALVNACNQKSNRDPVVTYDEETVETALDGLRNKGLSSRISGGSRVPKHEHRFTERCNLGRREEAVLCVLMLRGPQTVGELRGRTERLYTFDDLESVENTLSRLAEIGFVKQLPRQAGYKEQRWAQLLAGDVEVAEEASAPEASSPGRGLRIASGSRSWSRKSPNSSARSKTSAAISSRRHSACAMPPCSPSPAPGARRCPQSWDRRSPRWPLRQSAPARRATAVGSPIRRQTPPGRCFAPDSPRDW